MDSPLLVVFLEPKFYLVFLFLSLFHQLPHAQSHPEPVTSCDRLFRCGNITAGFPFWGDDRSVFCGHPWLKLECDKYTNKATLNWFGVRYNVLCTDNKNKTLKLSLKDFPKPLCLSDLEGKTQGFLQFFEYLQGYKNQTIFYSCLSHFQYLHDSSCPWSGAGKYCYPKAINVTVPEKFVLGVKAADYHNAGLEKAVKEGFWVKPKIYEKECEECLSRAGTCRVADSTLFPPFCCQSRSSLGSKCNPLALSESFESPRKGISRAPIIVIGVATTLGMITTIAIALVLCKLRKHKNARNRTWNS